MKIKWVYLFTEFSQALKVAGDGRDDVRGLLGGKGANLADMARINVPVPPGFTVTTEACRAYIESGKYRCPFGERQGDFLHVRSCKRL